MKTAVIYARYSSDSQTEQSIEGQLRVCNDFAKRNDYLVVDTYIDRAMTGTNDNRADFQRMLKDSAKRQWEVVLVYKLDRFSRNQFEAVINRKKLTDNGVRVVSAMENIPDTPEGRLFVSIIEGYNEYYSEDVRQKVKRGLKESWEKGLFSGGTVAFGYDVKDKKVVINEKEADALQTIFTLYARGYTATHIVETLQAKGVRKKNGRFVSASDLYKYIANTKYIGKVYFGEKWYDNIYPRIIDDVTWEKVQDIRKDNQHNPSRRKEIKGFILTGKLVCGECKRLMVGESGTGRSNQYHYYSCLTRRRNRGTCHAHSVDKKPLEDIVINTTWRLITDSDIMDLISQKLFELHQKETTDNTILKSLETRKRTAEKACSNLISAIEQGIITEQTRIRLRELEEEIAQLEIEINKEKQRTNAFLTPEKIKAFLMSVAKGDKDNVDIRKLLINTLIKEVILDKDEIVIVYNFTDHYEKHKIVPKDIEEKTKQSYKTANTIENGSYLLDSCPPKISTLYGVLNFLSKARKDL